MPHDDFITKREIRMYFTDVSNYRINLLFSEVRKHCGVIGINMFSRDTVPTKIFCKYWGLDLKKFLKVIGREELHEK